MYNVHADLETADPDDIITLLWFIAHPEINLTSITITPGYHDQIGLIDSILKTCQINIPVGSRKFFQEDNKESVSSFYKKVFDFQPLNSTKLAADVIYESLQKYNDLIIFTGAALTNIKLFFDKYPQVTIYDMVIQGGFAGDNVVALEDRLDKFKGKITCETFNLNGNPKAAEFILNSSNIARKTLISKNVCHGVSYKQEQHEQLEKIKDKHIALQLMFKTMSKYLEKNEDKKFHDPLAASQIIQENCLFKPVRLYRERGKWGSVEDPNSSTRISVKVDQESFWKTFFIC